MSSAGTRFPRFAVTLPNLEINVHAAAHWLRQVQRKNDVWAGDRMLDCFLRRSAWELVGSYMHHVNHIDVSRDVDSSQEGVRNVATVLQTGLYDYRNGGHVDGLKRFCDDKKNWILGATTSKNNSAWGNVESCVLIAALLELPGVVRAIASMP